MIEMWRVGESCIAQCLVQGERAGLIGLEGINDQKTNARHCHQLQGIAVVLDVFPVRGIFLHRLGRAEPA